MPKCCQCGGKERVKLYSPDLDIDPVPLCVVCWFEILGGARRRDDPALIDGSECGT